MTGYLGFDAERVDMLRSAMRRAEVELAAIHCADIDAASPMRAIALARSTLTDVWIPFVESLFQCRAMEGYVPTSLDRGDLVNSWLLAVAQQRGWRLATDPLAPDPLDEPMTVEAAKALGEALSGPAGQDSLTTEEIGWLAARIAEIAARPALVAAFLPAFTTVGWANVCNQLGEVRQHDVTDALMYDGSIDADERAGWSAIDSIFSALGAVLLTNREAHPLSDATLLLMDMTPYSAALLVAHLQLDADALSAVARSLIEREQIDLFDAAETNLGPRAADLLFATIVCTPAAATAYVLLTLDDPALVLDAAWAAQIGNAVLAAGTSPVWMTPDQAAVAIPILVRWVLNSSTFNAYLIYNKELAVAAADLIAPYLLPLLRPDGGGYSLSIDDRRAIEWLVLGDVEAFDHLLAARDRVAASLGSVIADPDVSVEDRLRALRDLAGVLAIIDTMTRASAIRSAEQDQAEWNLLWTALGYVSSAASVFGPPVWNAGGPAVTMLHRTADALGLGPPSVAGVRMSSSHRFDVMTTFAGAAVVCQRFDSMVQSGQIPAGTEPPPMPDVDAEGVGVRYDRAFTSWMSDNDFDPSVVLELSAVKNAIASSHEAEADANGELLGL